jgi:cell division inhibitor SepF
MSIVNKFKNMFSMSEEEFLDDVDVDDNDTDDEEYSKDVRSNFGFNRSQKQDNSSNNKVVDMRNPVPAATAASNKAHVVFKKLDRFEDVGSVGDVLNEKRIVILNLETCPNDISVRVLDFLSGVAYANNGEIKRVAGRAYIITPYNVPLTGELLDEMGNSNY